MSDREIREGTRPQAALAITQGSPPRIVKRTRGHTHGQITRLMSPSDFGRLLKPFVFLDLFDSQGMPVPTNMGLHPHSGIATIGYMAEGSVSYEDTSGAMGLIRAGGMEWMRAGGGVWHGGGGGEPGRARGFQLWIALPPELELGSAESVYVAPDVVPHNGPARVLLGRLGAARSSIQTPASMNYLAVRLKTGERWSYRPPAEHAVLWTAIAMGYVLVPDELQQGELVAFQPSGGPLQFEAKSDAEFMVGSAVSHDHELVLGTHSVHTSAAALREAEVRISEMRTRLIQQGRM
jgi:redox-sensitive bicupin YhaK (pirin superfamily)